jgi:hypothetical protein
MFENVLPMELTMSPAVLRSMDACDRGQMVWRRAHGAGPVPLTKENLEKYLAVDKFDAGGLTYVGPNGEDLEWLFFALMGVYLSFTISKHKLMIRAKELNGGNYLYLDRPADFMVGLKALDELVREDQAKVKPPPADPAAYRTEVEATFVNPAQWNVSLPVLLRTMIAHEVNVLYHQIPSPTANVIADNLTPKLLPKEADMRGVPDPAKGNMLGVLVELLKTGRDNALGAKGLEPDPGLAVTLSHMIAAINTGIIIQTKEYIPNGD